MTRFAPSFSILPHFSSVSFRKPIGFIPTSIAGLFACSAAMAFDLAAYIPTPENFSITAEENPKEPCGLPAESRILVKKEFSFDRLRKGGDPSYFYVHYDDKYEIDISGPGSNYKTKISPGTNWKIDRCEKGNVYFGGTMTTGIYRKDGGTTFSIPASIKEFNHLYGEYLQIIHRNPDYDPYSNMDQEIAVDIVMKKIVEALKESNYAAALPNFEYLLKMNREFPESFYYYHIETLAGIGDKQKVREKSTSYLKKYGKNGKYYKKVIEIMARL